MARVALWCLGRRHATATSSLRKGVGDLAPDDSVGRLSVGCAGVNAPTVVFTGGCSRSRGMGPWLDMARLRTLLAEGVRGAWALAEDQGLALSSGRLGVASHEVV